MKKLVSVMILVLALGAVGFSQRGGGGGGPYGRAGAQYGLLGNAEIQTALKLTDDQKSKLDAAAKARSDAFSSARAAGGDRAAMREAMQKAGADYASAVADTLTGDQKTQLLDIFVVIAKAPALTNPDVQSALSLGSDEVAKIKDLVTKEAAAGRALRQQVADGSMDAAAAAAARAKNAKTLSADLLAALTDDHRTAFHKMGADANFTPTKGTRYFGGGGRRPRGGAAGGGGG
ncbi:MAG: hypothetical protein ACYC96_12560 [Fimbriimonadaceae bacterium]